MDHLKWPETHALCISKMVCPTRFKYLNINQLFYDYQFKFFNSVYSNCAELVRGQNQSTHNEHECVIRFPQNWFFSVCPFFFTKNFPLCMGSSDYSKKATPQENQLFGKMGPFLSFYVLQCTKIPKNTKINWTYNFQVSN